MPIIAENWKMRAKYSWFTKLLRKYCKIRVGFTKPRTPVSDRDIAAKVERERRLVIQIPFGGLGDHLAYSSLPELLWKQKGARTFISDKSIFRSQAIRDFIWGLNPHVTFTDEKGWFINEPLTDDLYTLDEYLMSLFQLRGDGCPRVYYKPSVVGQLKGKTIVDASCGPTGRANGYFEPDFYRRFCDYLTDNLDEFTLIAHRHSGAKNDLEHEIMARLKPACYPVTRIEELADVLFSAKNRFLLHSGACSLSAAFGLHSNILNYLRPSTYNLYKYAIHNYIDLK